MSSRTDGPLAAGVAAALLRGDTDATEVELAFVHDSVADSVDAMPDFLRTGVRGVSAFARLVLFGLERRRFEVVPAERQTALAGRLSLLPLPGIAEFVRLTRGLGLVSLYEARATDTLSKRAAPAG